MNVSKFTKMVASGNDFIIIEGSHRLSTIDYRLLAEKICDRKYGIGADGLLILEKSKIADVRMRIFNADGSEAEMCGNGARCIGLFCWKTKIRKSKINIETKAGIIESKISNNNVRIKLTDPKNIRLDFPVRISGRKVKLNYIDTGVPHVVIFVDGINEIKVKQLGEIIRFHKQFLPRGANVNFVEPRGNNYITIRTYERGVEDETLACGTGSVASALIFSIKTASSNRVKVKTQSGEILNIYFKKDKNIFHDVWLEGKAELVYKGEYHPSFYQ